ncbi:MAG: SH3 domain-containing protein [Saprospiraceae bacterium]
MDKKYFLVENGRVTTAQSLDELIAYNINGETLVCKKFEDWKEAKDIPEVFEILKQNLKPTTEAIQPSFPSIEENNIQENFQFTKIDSSQKQQIEEYNNSNRTIIIIVSAILVAAFFMPWIKFFVNITGFDIVFGEAGKFIGSSIRYLLAIIPISSILILFWTINYNNYPLPKILLFFSPIVSIIIVGSSILNELGGGDVSQILGLGFWLTLIGAIILPFQEQNYMLEDNSSVSTTTKVPTENQEQKNSLENNIFSEETSVSFSSQSSISDLHTREFNNQQSSEYGNNLNISVNANSPTKVVEDFEKGNSANEKFLTKYRLPLFIGSFIIVTGLASFFIFLNKNDSPNSEITTILQSNSEPSQNVNSAPNFSTVYVKTKEGTTLRLRSQPSESAKVIDNIPDGTTLDVIGFSEQYEEINGEKAKWCNVIYNGKNGWAWGGFLENKVNDKIEGTNNLVEEINAKLASLYNSKYRVVTDNDKNWSKYDFDNFITPERKKFQYFPYIVKGDFNGDGISDLAAEIKNTENNFERLVFIFGGNNLIKFYDGQLCSSISFIPANEWVSHWESGSLKLNADAIIVSCFEKSGWILYWDGNTIKEYWISD